MDAVVRIDPFAAIVGPAAGVDPPDPAIARARGVRDARPSVVRIRGYSCGLGVEGSGWVVRPGLVVTNAHVVAGVERPSVDRGGRESFPARVVSFDARNDVAILRVRGLRAAPLRTTDPETRQPAALLGFPENGPYRVTPVRMGRNAVVGTRDVYGGVQFGRPIVALRGNVKPGNSGGPVVDAQGNVVATLFAQRRGSDDGYAVPNAQVDNALANVGPPLATACAAR
jgi:S1-C subfamily serine protease